VCLGALILALIFTGGMTPSFDSVRYANVAHWISAGEGISTSLTVVPVQEGLPSTGDGLFAFTIQPPGLPLFYAATGVDHRDVSHRLLNIFAFVSLAWLVMALGRDLTGRSDVGVAASLLTILSPLMLLTVAHFWTDLPSAAFLLGALYLVIRSRRPGPRPWAWLAGASVLAGISVAFRLTSLAFGLVIVVDVLMNLRLKWRTQLIRLVAGSGVFGIVALGILVRSTILAGRYSGIPAHDWPIASEYSLARGWAYLGSRFLQALTPAWAVEAVSGELAAVNATPEPWIIPAVLFFVLAGAALAFVILHRRRHASWSLPGNIPFTSSHALAAALILGSVVVLLLPASRNPNFHVVELRFAITLLPFLWIAILAVVMSSRRCMVDISVAALLVVVFAIGVPGRYQPYRHNQEFMRSGLDWLKQAVPPETPVFSNGGKVLLDQDLTRRVYHISDWNFRHVLGPEMKTERGLLEYLRDRDIRYVALFGSPNLNQGKYWGRPVIALFLEMLWKPWLVYHDQHLKVYRIPPTGIPERETG